MVGADSGPIVAVKIFVEKDEVAPVWIALKEIDAARNGPAAVRITQKDVCEPPGNFGGDLPEIGFVAGMRRAFHFKIFALLVLKLLHPFPHYIITRNPHGPS